jgi:hypothetical protein
MSSTVRTRIRRAPLAALATVAVPDAASADGRSPAPEATLRAEQMVGRESDDDTP